MTGVLKNYGQNCFITSWNGSCDATINEMYLVYIFFLPTYSVFGYTLQWWCMNPKSRYMKSNKLLHLGKSPLRLPEGKANMP